MGVGVCSSASGPHTASGVVLLRQGVLGSVIREGDEDGGKSGDDGTRIYVYLYTDCWAGSSQISI